MTREAGSERAAGYRRLGGGGGEEDRQASAGVGREEDAGRRLWDFRGLRSARGASFSMIGTFIASEGEGLYNQYDKDVVFWLWVGLIRKLQCRNEKQNAQCILNTSQT